MHAHAENSDRQKSRSHSIPRAPECPPDPEKMRACGTRFGNGLTATAAFIEAINFYNLLESILVPHVCVYVCVHARYLRQ